MTRYRIYFASKSALILPGESEEAARFEARLIMWRKTGEWMKVQRVEVVDETEAVCRT